MPLILNASLSISYNDGFVMPIRYQERSFYGSSMGTEDSSLHLRSRPPTPNPKPPTPTILTKLHPLLLLSSDHNIIIITPAIHTIQTTTFPNTNHPQNTSPPQKTTIQTSLTTILENQSYPFIQSTIKTTTTICYLSSPCASLSS